MAKVHSDNETWLRCSLFVIGIGLDVLAHVSVLEDIILSRTTDIEKAN